jgi:DinB superfamily
MPDSIEFLTNRLRTEGEKSIQFFTEIKPEKWVMTIYTDGSCWTLRQVLSHFAQSESSLRRLVENIANGGQGTPENFDLNAYNEYKVSTIDAFNEIELLTLFRENRQKTIDMVSRLTEHDLQKRGRHPFLGNASLLDIIKMIYRHNQIHIREIRQILG